MELLKWFEYQHNENQVIFFRDADWLNGFALLYNKRGEWEYEGLGNYGYIPGMFKEPERPVPVKYLRRIIKDVFIEAEEIRHE